MKSKGLLSVLVLCSTALFSQAQKTIAEGTLQYDIAIQSAGSNNGTLQGASATVYVKGVFSRNDMVSSLGNEKTIYDARQGTGVILKEYSGQKLMITLTRENWAEKNQRSEGISFADQAETREISGYTCYKTVATLNDGSSILAFYTRDLQMQNKDYNPLFKNLKGVPLYYEVESGKLKFIYSLQKIDFNPIPQSRFELPKSGYRVISYAETQTAGKTR